MFSSKLGHFRGCGRRYANYSVKDGAVHRGRHFSGLGIETANYFRNVATSHRGVAWVLAFGREGDEELLSIRRAFAGSFQPVLVTLFQNWNHDFFRGSGIGRAFEDDQLAGAQVGRDGLGGVGNVAEVGFVVFVQRRRDADNDGIHFGDAGVVRRSFEAFGAGFLNFAGQDADNVRSALGQGRNFALIDIKACDLNLLLGIKQSQRQTDVAKTDDGDTGLTFLNLRQKVRDGIASGSGIRCLRHKLSFPILARQVPASSRWGEWISFSEFAALVEYFQQFTVTAVTD